MTVTPERFSEFFAALHDEATPYRWQIETLEELMATGRWPEVLDIPTGGGKSAVIPIHVFANAADQERAESGALPDDAPRVPRRLSVTVSRRSVVDSHLDRATDILRQLEEAEGGILAEVRGLLIRRSTPADSQEQNAAPLRVNLMRGGTVSVKANGDLRRLREEWVNYPAAVQVLCATPDMLGSRLLFRGYGLSRRARPRSAGLLAYDHVAVIDEAHLSRQFTETFRRVQAMVSRPSTITASVPPLQVCASTATQHGSTEEGSPERSVISLDWENLDAPLVPILLNPKPVEYRGTAAWNQTQSKHAAEVMAAVDELRSGNTEGTVGVVMNWVRTALAVQELAAKQGLRTKLLVGPMRLGTSRDLSLENVDVLIATQTIEVGVDLDFHGLVTDLAPGTSLAQRAGRVNRHGRRPESRVIVLGPEKDASVPDKKAAPYSQIDLQAAQAWVLERAEDPRGLSPQALHEAGIPQAATDRPVFSHLNDADVRLFSRTSEPLPGEPDLTFWLRDSLEPETQELRVVGRRLPPFAGDDASRKLDTVQAASELLPHLEIEEREIYPSTPAVVRQILSDEKKLNRFQAWVQRDEEWTLLQTESFVKDSNLPFAEVASSFSFRGGDLVLLDSRFPCTLGISDEPKNEHGLVLLPEGTRPIGDSSDSDSTGLHIFLHEKEPGERPSEGTRVCRSAANDALDEEGELDPRLLPIDLPQLDEVEYRCLIGPETEYSDGSPAWVVCARQDVVAQEQPLPLAATEEPVTLEDHQHDVAARAACLARLLGLSEGLQEALRKAGAHHDDGKCSAEFQTLLRLAGNRPEDGLDADERSALHRQQRGTVYAKSSGLLAPHRVLDAVSPRGWRHEMLSAAMWWAQHGVEASALPASVSDAETALWLIGTHHGEGRSGFSAPASQVCLSHGSRSAVETAAYTLYTEGLWDDVAQRMDSAYGVWGTCYLEALLRAADNTISQEGR